MANRLGLKCEPLVEILKDREANNSEIFLEQQRAQAELNLVINEIRLAIAKNQSGVTFNSRQYKFWTDIRSVLEEPENGYVLLNNPLPRLGHVVTVDFRNLDEVELF